MKNFCKKNAFLLKRAFILIISVLMIVLSFAGCSSESSATLANTVSTSSELVNFKANTYDIEVGESKYVRFTVESNLGESVESVSLYTGNTAIASMTDDGQNGDLISGDGIYTCSISLSSDKRSNIDYYAYYDGKSSNTFTICFYQNISEDEYSGFIDISNAVNECTDYSSAYNIISTSSGVENFTADEDNKSIEYKTIYGITGYWQLKDEGVKKNSYAAEDIQIPSDDQYYGDIFSQINNLTVGSFSSKKSVLVLRPFRNDGFDYDDFLYAGAALAYASNGALDVYDDYDAGIDVFKSFGNYGTVLIDSHGSLSADRTTTYILTGELVNYDTVSKYSQDINGERIIEANGRFMVSSSFFDKYYSTNSLNDTTLFLGTCYSAYNSSFGNTFAQKGSPLILGYSDSVYVPYCNDTLYNFMIKNMLINGKEADEAFSSTVSECGESDGLAEFVMFKNGEEVRLYDLNYQSSSGNVTSFSTPESMNIVLGEAGVIEPNIEMQNDAEYTIRWTSSNTDVVNVNSEGSTGILNTVSSGEAVITATLVSSEGILTSETIVNVAPIARDVVLVLDCSGSMYGRPFDELQDVAYQFCEDILNDNSNNRVAIVTFETDVYSTDLTSDISSLQNYITSMSTTGVTNTYGGLERAGQILADQGADDSIKNIIIMTDGLPNSGQTSMSGSFTYTTINGTFNDDSYANAVVDIANDLMSNYNLYSLGFFHSLDGISLDYASQLVSQLTNQENGYYQVEDAENLQFAFGDIGENINDGSRIIINIACPVDVKVELNGEYISSNPDDFVDETSFGSLSLLGENKDVKVVSLDSSNIYDVSLTGTNDGSMDYSVNYYDNDNKLYDSREFSNVPLSSTCKIDSTTDNSDATLLNIDSDGNGVYDDVWEANAGSLGSSTTQKQVPVSITASGGSSVLQTWQIILMVSCAVLLIVVIILATVLPAKIKKKQPIAQKNNGSQAIESYYSNNMKDWKNYNQQYMNSYNDNAHNGDTDILNRQRNQSASVAQKAHNFKINPGLNNKFITYELQGNSVINIGKDSSWANIVLPASYSKASRKHCSVYYDNLKNKFVINDISLNGLKFENGKKLAKGINYLNKGDTVYFPDNKCSITFGD